jgi:tetratricopeptide (TPR) repeat protein
MWLLQDYCRSQVSFLKDTATRIQPQKSATQLVQLLMMQKLGLSLLLILSLVTSQAPSSLAIPQSAKKRSGCNCKSIKEMEARYKKELAALEVKEGRDSRKVADKSVVLARLYLSMGLPEKTESLDQHAVSIYEKSIPGNLDVLGPVLIDLSEAYAQMGNKEKSETYIKRAMPFVSKNTNNASAFNQAARVFEHKRDWPKVENYQKKALEIISKKSGPDSLEVAEQLELISRYHRSRGDLKAAARELQGAVDIKKKLLKDTNPSLYLSMDRLGWLYLNLHEYAKAEGLFKTVLENRQQLLGKEHPYLVDLLRAQARALRQLKRIPEAKQLESRADMIATKHGAKAQGKT